MSEYTIHDFIRESEKQDAFYKEQISKLDNILDDYRKKIEELQSRKNAKFPAIANSLVPEFTEKNINNLGNTLGSNQICNQYDDYKSEKKELKSIIEEIEKNDDFQKKEALTNPESGVIPSQLSEIRPLYNSAKEIFEKIDRFPGFQGLRARRYGTSSYPYQGFKKYFIPQFYADWKRADEIVESMKVKDFIDILSQYEQSAEQVNALGASIKDYESQLINIQKMAREYNEKTERLNKLSEIYWEKLGNSIWNFFKSSDTKGIQKLLNFNPNLEEDFKIIDGLEHQIEYLKHLYEKVVEERGKLLTKAGKIKEEAQRYKINEYKYRNKRFSEEQFSTKFAKNSARYDSMYERYYGYGDTLYSFNNYGVSSLVSDFLWWDLITDGRIDGNFIPEVNEYYSSHPDYEYESPAENVSSDQS